MRPIGTPKQLWHRRRQALKLLDRGRRSTEVARLVGVTPRSVRRWRREVPSPKRKVPSTRRRPGRPCRLSSSQLKQLERKLAHGALAYGYAADYWSLIRVRSLVRKEFKIHYHPSGIWHLLRRMNWSCQKPQRLAFQRDETVIAYWKRYRWPWIKKVAPPGGDPCFPR